MFSKEQNKNNRGSLRLLIQKYPRISVLTVFSFILSIILFAPLHVTMVRFKSVNYSFALWEDVDATAFAPHIGQYILFNWHDSKHEFAGLKQGDLLIKKVGCLPGNVLEVQEGNLFYCDGSYLGPAVTEMPFSKTPVSIFPYPQKSVIPDGRIFVIGDSHTSYDSRYFGFVPVEHVVGRVLFGIN